MKQKLQSVVVLFSMLWCSDFLDPLGKRTFSPIEFRKNGSGLDWIEGKSTRGTLRLRCRRRNFLGFHLARFY